MYGDQQGQLRLQGKVGGVPGPGVKLRTGVEAGGSPPRRGNEAPHLDENCVSVDTASHITCR